MSRQLASLPADDRAFFDDLRACINLHPPPADETATAAQLHPMLLDLADASRGGMSAREYFGDDPKGMAGALLEQLPRARAGDFAKGAIPALIVYLMVMVLASAGACPVMRLSAARLALDAGIAGLAVVALLGLVRVSIYPRRPPSGRPRMIGARSPRDAIPAPAPSDPASARPERVGRRAGLGAPHRPAARAEHLPKGGVGARQRRQCREERGSVVIWPTGCARSARTCIRERCGGPRDSGL